MGSNFQVSAKKSHNDIQLVVLGMTWATVENTLGGVQNEHPRDMCYQYD